MNVCKVSSKLFPRGFTDDIKNTGKSFKSWDSCMNDKPCKIIAIVGICLAAVVGLWLIGGILTCFRQGVTGVGQFLCWCCNCNGSSKGGVQQHQNAYVPQQPAQVIYQPIQPPESVYYRNDPNSFYSEPHGGDTGKSEVFELEQEFDLEKQRAKSQKRNKNKNRSPTRDPLTGRESQTGNQPSGSYEEFLNNQANHTNTYKSPYPKDDYNYRGDYY